MGTIALTKIFKGNIIYTQVPKHFTAIAQGFIVVIDGRVEGTYETLPLEYKDHTMIDCGDHLIIPGMNDLHCHAPQFKNLGMAMDKELLPWLNQYTFPEESKFIDLEYSEMIYQRFIREIWKQGTTRIAVFATIHKAATTQLMELFIQSGLGAYIGKVNMDQNAPPFLCENTDASLLDTEEILVNYKDRSLLVKPIITPRFIPSCSSAVLKGLGTLCMKYNVPVQSHLSENNDEITWVKKLYPNSKFYAEIYNQYNLFGQTPTLMAHCCLSPSLEIALIKEHDVMAVHCPTSNLNVGSGMMSIRNFMDQDIRLAFGSDISAGHTCSIFKTMTTAIQVSKMIWAQSNKQMAPLSNSEAFYIATKGGGSFFGKVGSFEKGYDFDALIIDDSEFNYDRYTLEQRLERFIYCGDDRHIISRYVCGNLIKEPSVL